jgi:hypothetical protein
MKTLTSPLSAEAAASQAGWAELYDIYLKTAISTPFGTIATLRLTTLPGGMSFFKPKLSPEPTADQGNPEDYIFWPVLRQAVKASSGTAEEKLTFVASNVTTEFATMLAAIDWYDTPVIIRAVSTSIVADTADDCAILFSGMIDAAVITDEAVQFSCSHDVTRLSIQRPSETSHTRCRFKFGSDLCTALPWLPENYKAGTVGNASTTKKVISTDLSEDSGARGSYGTDLIDALANAAFTASNEKAGQEAYRVRATYSSDWWGWASGAAWGTNEQGVWQINTGEEGIKNSALQPWWRVDLGSAKKPVLWRVKNVGGTRDFWPRLLVFFSSANDSSWTFETYHEMPALSNVFSDILIPKASTARYWRICMRSKWGETNDNAPIFKIEAYLNSRHWWASGAIKFDGATATAALRSVSAKITESYSGEVHLLRALPATPANGDTFVVMRSCPGSFNACNERANVENFGGFDSLPFEQVQR